MKIDIICTQPSHVDFPLWRKYLTDNQGKFNKILVGFSNANHWLNILSFQKEQLSLIPNLHLIEDMKYIYSHDWRSSAITKCLAQSDGTHVLFLEQDFLIKDPAYFEELLSKDIDLLGFKESTDSTGRLHPAFLLVKRDLLNKTSLNFSAFPPQYDHFGKVSEELESLCKAEFLKPDTFTHMAGLTHNYSLLMANSTPNYKIDEFRKYNQECLKLTIQQCPHFLQYIEKAVSLIG